LAALRQVHPPRKNRYLFNVDIAFIVNQFPSVSQTFVLNQIVGLIERGHHVDVYTWSRGNSDFVHSDVARWNLLDRTYQLQTPRNRWLRFAKGIEIFTKQLGKKPGAALRSLNVFQYGRRALSLSLLFETAPFFRNYDVVHCQFGKNGQFGAILKQIGLQKKLVVTFHGYDIREGVAAGAQMYKDLWEEADCVIAISKYNQEKLLRFGALPEKIVLHPVGIDCRRFPYRPASLKNGGPIKLLSIGRLVKEKGFESGIRAFHRLLQKKPELAIRYDIIGEGCLRNSLAALIDELGLKQQVRLLGAREQERIVPALQAADIFFAPSLAEVLPVALMEAHAVGLPIVATRVGSVDQIVIENRSGYLVPPGDVCALSQRLEALIDHPEEWESMGRAGRQHVEQCYDIDRLNDRLVKIYQQLLDGQLPSVSAQLPVAHSA
jgi:colanic acid/amylovoran/stewartan biosynthesis glycosyltransferase WcaL/AmsK/CpsK